MKRTSLTRIFLIIILSILIVIPLIRFTFAINVSDFKEVIVSDSWKTLLYNTLWSTLLATVISVGIALVCALLLIRKNIKRRSLFVIIFTVPMLIPSISHGLGLVIILGNNGFLTKVLNLAYGIYGFTGVVIGGFLYSFPVAFIMLYDILSYEDLSTYQAAKILGISNTRAFLKLTLAYLKKPLCITFFAIFTLIITDYGVPIAIGGKFDTIAKSLYLEATNMLNYGKSSVYSLCLLLPAFLAFIMEFSLKSNNNSELCSNHVKQTNRSRLLISYIILGCVSLICLLPILAFVSHFSIVNIVKVFQNGIIDKLYNSLIISTATGFLGITTAFFCSYLVIRSESKHSRILLHGISILPMAIPGLVLGISYVTLFKNSPMYNTVFILIAVNLAHFISTPYIMLTNCLKEINMNLEKVGRTLGISRIRVIWSIIIPQSFSTLCECFAYFFINCMMTISAVSFLANSKTMPISLMINVYERQMQFEEIAIVSLIILMVNLTLKGIIRLITKNRGVVYA